MSREICLVLLSISLLTSVRIIFKLTFSPITFLLPLHTFYSLMHAPIISDRPTGLGIISAYGQAPEEGSAELSNRLVITNI